MGAGIPIWGRLGTIPDGPDASADTPIDDDDAATMTTTETGGDHIIDLGSMVSGGLEGEGGGEGVCAEGAAAVGDFGWGGRRWRSGDGGTGKWGEGSGI